MLRVVSTIYIESQALRCRDVLKLSRGNALYSSAAGGQTVLSNESANGSGAALQSTPPLPLSPPPPPRPPRSRSAWTAAAAVAFSASVGGVYLYRKLNDDVEPAFARLPLKEHGGPVEPLCESVPARAEQLPAHAQYLLVGGGTAAFAAMRAIRSARPDSQVLIVSEEPALPYMRPPISKELWREPDLAQRALTPDTLTFRQWNGKRRSVTYEPNAFYTAPERLREKGAGAGVARGWRVVRVHPERHSADLEALGGGGVTTITYDKCLIATGVRPRRVAALRAAAAAGRALTLRTARDAARLAAALDDPAVARVLVVGGGFLATELSAALAERLHGSGREVRQVFREGAPLAHVLPRYLAADAARRLRQQGVQLLPHTEITGSEVHEGLVRLRTASTRAPGGPSDGEGELQLEAELVVECVGCEPDDSLARASGLELHPELGGLLVNAELQARTDVWAAGDVASFHDVSLGRRRVEHHDHAVVSGRLAGENMAALRGARPYTHQSMFWSDLGPRLGYEAIGIIDSRLPTVGVFSEDAVKESELADREERAREDETRALVAVAAAEPGAERVAETEGAEVAEGGVKQFERGVVFYVRDERVVGVLLWNLFNRMQVARQVLAHGKFDDLFEAAKLFTPHEED